MKCRILVATAALASLTFVAAAHAADPSAATDPGFVPDTGQINPGHAAQPWSAAPPLPQSQQPAQEDARAALMTPDNGAPSAGQGAVAAPNGPPPNNPAPNNGQASGAQLNGGNPAAAAAASAGPSAAPSGPIGATLQTMPAKFSKRNDLLDHMPIAAWPLPLNEQQRQQIYQAVMADKSPPASGAAKLKPADSLSFEQQHEMRPLPESLASIDGLTGLQYLKGKDKVLLVRPSTGIVVDEVAM